MASKRASGKSKAKTSRMGKTSGLAFVLAALLLILEVILLVLLAGGYI